jgi:GT2 family glycosyltransferase
VLLIYDAMAEHEPHESDPTATVVVLTHNRAHLLRECVENVLLRTSPLTRQIIIWNNGSTDDTAEYLDSLNDARIQVVQHDRNIGQNAYARAFRLATGEYYIELDDDIVDAPQHWDSTLVDALRRLPEVGFLAADLEDDPYDVAAHYRYRIRPHEYRPAERNGVGLLLGPTGGGCAVTPRRVYDEVGGFSENKRSAFFLEDAAYIEKVTTLGYEVAVLAGLKVLHHGGDYYTSASKEKAAYWAATRRRQRRRNAVKRVLFALPLFRRLNARFGWVAEPAIA